MNLFDDEFLKMLREALADEAKWPAVDKIQHAEDARILAAAFDDLVYNHGTVSAEGGLNIKS